jgi:hypothetical protein
MNWARILAYVTGTVDQELLLRNEYLAAENCILRERPRSRAAEQCNEFPPPHVLPSAYS